MTKLPQPDLTLNDSTRPLVENNAQGLDNLEIAFSFLKSLTFDDAQSYLADHSDKVSAQYPELNVDSTVAYIQTLITACADLTTSAFASHCAVDKDRSSLTIKYGMAADAEITINIIGGDNVIGNGMLAGVFSDDGLYDNIRAIYLDIFLNANPYTVIESNIFPINRLLKTMYELNCRQTPSMPIADRINKFLNITGIDGWQEITAKMVNAALLSTVLGRLIKLKLPSITPTIRLTSGYANLLLNDLTNKNEIRLSDYANEKTRYYNVYWEGFVDGEKTGYGSTPVCCVGMFNIINLAMMISLQQNFDKALIVSWQKLDNLQDYRDMKA